MKKLLILLMMIGMPVYANVGICENAGNSEYDGCVDFPEDYIQSIETIKYPTYGVRVNLKNGNHYDVPAETRGQAILQLIYAYESLQEYYGWDEHYQYQILDKQDKAKLGIH